MVSSRSSNNAFRAFLSLAAIATGASGATTPVDYADGDFPLLGYASVPENAAKGEKLPAVVILPDWNNIDGFEKSQAEYLSGDLGYVGFAADLYGPDLHDVQEFDVKVAQASMLRGDPSLYLGRINAAIDTVSAMPEVDPSRIAIIGYCLGGSGVLMYSFSNNDVDTSRVVAAASFHGGLMDFEITGDIANKVLVLSGGDDDAGTAVEDLEARLKDANATWQITRYSGVEHGFAVPKGAAYNEWAATRSHAEMETFLDEAFSMTTYGSEPPVVGVDFAVVGADGTPTEGAPVAVETVEYDQDGFALEGYLAHPVGAAAAAADASRAPGLIILPDWDGVNGPAGYEAERAALAAEQAGMIAMVADIYGKNHTNVDDMQMRVELATTYRSDPDLFVGRIRTAIDVLRANPMVDTDHIYVAGYCLGGTGAMDYAFSSGALDSVRAVVPIHGGLNPLRAVKTDKVLPHVLVLSGGIDDAHGNTTELEQQLDGAGATWEITRYSNTDHGFTKWGAGAYNAMADSRSWESMMTLFTDLRTMAAQPEPSMTETTEVETTEKDEDDASMAPVAAPVVETVADGSHDGSHDDKDEEEEDDHKDGDHGSHDHGSHDDHDDMKDESSSSAARALAGGLSVTGAALVAAMLA